MGFFDFPVITIASYPLFRNEIQNVPPELPSPHIPVCGDIPDTVYLPEEGLRVPVTGPVSYTHLTLPTTPYV